MLYRRPIGVDGDVTDVAVLYHVAVVAVVAVISVVAVVAVDVPIFNLAIYQLVEPGCLARFFVVPSP